MYIRSCHYRRLSSISGPILPEEVRSVLRLPDVRDHIQRDLQLGRRSIRQLVNLFCCGSNVNDRLGGGPFSERDVVAAFRQFAAEHAAVKDQNIIDMTDLRSPSGWYPLARSIKRNVIMNCGPTNSGKTHAALISLQSSSSGAYSGPLRLLAWEVFNRMNDSGVACDLVTGQEMITKEASQHRSSTVEMTDTKLEIECAVVDEIQMIGDVSRGHAWTRAVLGVPAHTVYLCGDESACGLVEELCDLNGDDLTVVRHERLGKLEFSQPLRSLSQVTRGDCLIAFSRRDILALKSRVERCTNLKACVVYGNLPPFSRQNQAALFNDPDSGYDILIASDAVGMGLNLSIKRIVFTSLRKFDGNNVRRLNKSEILQIAGRAGRFNSAYPNGQVTCLLGETSQADIDFMKGALRSRPDPIHRAGLAPEFAAIQSLAEARPYLPYHNVLQQFQQHAVLDGLFFMSEGVQELIDLSQTFKEIPLSLTHRHTFAMAPVAIRSKSEVNNLVRLVKQFTESSRAELAIYPKADAAIDGRDQRIPLSDLELLSAISDVYIWLGKRLPREFTDMERAEFVRTRIVELIQQNLESFGSWSGDKPRRRR